MNGFMDKLSEKIMPLANLLGQNRYLTVLRDAFMLSFPLTMFGSIVVVINNLPFFSDATKGTLSNLFGNGQNATMSIMSVLLLLVSAIIYQNLMTLKVFSVVPCLLPAS